MLAIPKITNLDIALGSIAHMPKYETLPEDFRRHNGNAYVRAISSWFFSGAKKAPDGIEIDGVTFTAKPGVDAQQALAAIKAVLGSFDPPHEEKEAGCAFMLAEWFDMQPKARA